MFFSPRRAPSSVGRPVDPDHIGARIVIETGSSDRVILTATGTPYRGDGYAVPLTEHHAELPVYPDFHGLAADVAEWVATAAHAVMTVATPARYFSATYGDDGYLHLDVVQLFSSADWDDARRAARARGIAEVHHTGPDALVPTRS